MRPDRVQEAPLISRFPVTTIFIILSYGTSVFGAKTRIGPGPAHSRGF